MPKRHYSKKIPARIDALLTEDLVKLDQWAFGTFLPSIKIQFERKGNITDKQYEHLARLEEKFSDTNKEMIIEKLKEAKLSLEKERAEWTKKYCGTQIEKDAKLIAAYYEKINLSKGQQYYHHAVSAILRDETPSEKLCMRMINNQYSQRVLEEHKKAPLYPVNSLVQPRKMYTKSWNTLNGVDFAFVVKVDVDIPSARKGGKKYLILPKGYTKGIVVEERELKLYRRKK